MHKDAPNWKNIIMFRPTAQNYNVTFIFIQIAEENVLEMFNEGFNIFQG